MNKNFSHQESVLNYREFLSKIVKFKKVVDFKSMTPIPQE
jgi:hypothetical protein